MILPFGPVYPVAAHSIDGLSLLLEKITLSTSLTLQRHEVSLQSSLNCLCKARAPHRLQVGPWLGFPPICSLRCAPLCVRALLYMLCIGVDGVKLYICSLFFKNVNLRGFPPLYSLPCAPLCVWVLLYMLCIFSLFSLKMSTFGFS